MTWLERRANLSAPSSRRETFPLTLPFIERANRTSLTMSACQTLFERTSPFTYKSFFFASFAVFRIGLDKHGSFVI